MAPSENGLTACYDIITMFSIAESSAWLKDLTLEYWLRGHQTKLKAQTKIRDKTITFSSTIVTKRSP